MFYKHLKGVLTEAECQELIARGHSLGFEQALVNNYGQDELLTNIRNNERVQFADQALAVDLGTKLLAALRDRFPYHVQHRQYVKPGEHFRMYRYTPGQYFKPHRDGSFQDKELESEITVLFYLNDADGGETVLMPYGLQQKWAHQAFQPKAGDVLMFEHNIWHEGRPVNSGEKYVLRTDLFYSQTEICKE
jgi:predicted 2-oxoglutarate/Fe(II)-dependent dioxygenase YbiX